jgi:hypothetical protein
MFRHVIVYIFMSVSVSYLIIQCTYIIVFGVYTKRNFRVFYKKYIQPRNLPAIVSRRMTRNEDMLIQINNKGLFPT